MIAEQSIPCPDCQNKIFFDPIELVRGHKFSCSKCFAVIGIAQDALETAHDAMAKYEALKSSSRKKHQLKKS